MTLSLEKISKHILLLGLALLLFRNSSFVLTLIPKPFEVCFIIVTLLTLIDLIKNRKFAEFFLSIPKNIRIASIVMLASIAVGWVMAVFFRHIPSTANMLYELVAFLVAAFTGVLILYYSRNDPSYIRKCLYALAVPAVYSIFVFFPQVARFFGLAAGGFNGFTDNVNIVSKQLLIPLMLFVTLALLESKSTLRRIGYSILSILLVALVFWAVQRAAVLGFVIGAATIWCVLVWSERSWKKMIFNGCILLAIFGLGFLAVPSEAKKVALNRIVHFDGNQISIDDLEGLTVVEIVQSIIHQKSESVPVTVATLTDEKKSPEPRFQIWAHYVRIVLANPLGLGPNTHITASIPFAQGNFTNPGPHNTYLEMWLWGGIAGILSFMYILVYTFRSLIRSLRDKSASMTTALAILGSLVALSVTIFFNDNMGLIWFWAMLALALRA